MKRAVHVDIIAVNGADLQPVGPQAVAPSRKSVYRNPKRVPSVVPVASRTGALMSARAGRSIHQAAADVPCSTLVVIEEWLRSIEARLAELRDELRGRRAA